MKKSLLLIIAVFFAWSSHAQSVIYTGPQPSKDAVKHSAAEMINTTPFLGFEELQPAHVNPNVPVLENRGEFAQDIGTSFYDLQSNNSTQNRMAYDPNLNRKLATWTMGIEGEQPAYPNRGTGFNGYNLGVDGDWRPHPGIKIEATDRTGWPAVNMLADGTPIVLAHTADYRLHFSKWDETTSIWNETDIPTAAPEGALWPRMTVGGPDGNTVHALAITPPTGNLGGTIYEGLNSHLLYYRSLDGGTTWDKVDVIIPGLDSTKYTGISADTYSIDADGETIAVAHYADFGDIVVAKSTDNGDTWNLQIVHDWPFDKYTFDDGWSTAAIPPKDTVGAIAPGAILTSDETGEVLVDRDGKVHVWFGEMWLRDTVPGDGTSTFFPTSSGIYYWNETHGADSVRLVAGLIDSDGDGVFTLQDLGGTSALGGRYANQGLTGQITAGVDAENNIYMAYAAVTEFFYDNANPQLQHNRHILLTATEDQGETWMDDPVDLITEDYVADGDLIPRMETVFPSMARNVGEFVMLSYQLDFEPGHSVGAAPLDVDPPGTNTIYVLELDPGDLNIVRTEEVVNPENFNLTLAPNPAQGNVLVSYELSEAAQTTISVVNMMGQEVSKEILGNQTVGKYSHNLDINNLANGVYLVQFKADNQLSVRKLVVK